MNYQVIRNVALQKRNTYGNKYLTREKKYPMVWKTSEAIQGAATAAGISYNGQFREARLKLAREVYGRRITSYNDLTDPELDALSQWATTQGLELKNWLISRYGKQTRL